MTAVLHRQQSAAGLLCSSLEVERTDIVFANVAPNRVHIQMTVFNRGDLPTPPTRAVVQAAPLGAFVPWRPLAVLDVPSLLPGASHVLQLDAKTAPAVALGDADRVPPQRVLTALADEDDPNLVRRGTPQLPTDLFSLLRRGGAHWAGNLNIFFEGRTVERHLAQALRIYPGQTNLAMFVVGARADAYSFSLHGEGADWDAALHDITFASRHLATDERAVPLNEWVEIGRMGMMMLALRPPADCQRGTVEVHVLQRSTGEQAIVEFSLDANASGPGCFVV
jgi:hypothetical protein